MANPPESTASGRSYWISALLLGLLTALPFLLVEIPPITDLPQQTAQLRLLEEARASPEGPYRSQWLRPNKLGYLPLALTWRLAEPVAAGRLAVLLLGLLWVGTIHGLAWRTGRGPAAAALASLFFFNHITYWGFLSFTSGLPVFLLWVYLTPRLPRWRPPWDGLLLLAVACLLAWAHVLWLAAGGLWWGVLALRERWSWRILLRQGLWWLPLGVAIALWYPSLGQAGFESEVVQGRPPWGRLHPGWLVGSAFGGLEGSTEGVIAAAVLAWVVLGLWQARQHWGQRVEGRLLLAAALLLALALFLPAVAQNTIFLASRWLPGAVVLAVLALPSPRLSPLLKTAVPWALAACLSAATAAAWMGFEREELAGFEGCLAAVPEDSRLLGLAMIRDSPSIRGFPYYHLYAYAQAMHGGELNRSFAELASSLVVYRDLPRDVPWTEGLDWRPERLRQSDLPHFDHVLVYGTPQMHGFFGADPKLTAVTDEAPWRLYRIRDSG